jgi:mono/diheme cytochrome c family protein
MMIMSPLKSLIAAFALSGSLLALAAVAQTAQKPNRSAGFEVIKDNCLRCHNGQLKSGGIDLSAMEAALKTGAIRTPNWEESRVWQQVKIGKMPPTGKLPDVQIKQLSEWLKQGAIYPHSTAVQEKPLWSFQPIKTPAVPKTKYDTLAKNPVDRFVFAEMTRQKLTPSPEADKRTLIRRVTIDLTGLPPTPQEIAAFLADKSPNAYEKLVDRLLASPAYGERWARHWLDVVRFGESTGYEQNHVRPTAWYYRDWAIRAFNQDLPFADFVTQQLAGDVVGKGNPQIETATGYLVAGIHDTVGIQTEEGTRQQRSNDLDDLVSTTSAAFLGMTVGCARCHDHKFDPIPQKDYYRLMAAFAGVRHGERPLGEPDEQAREAQEKLRIQITQASNQINAMDNTARERIAAQREPNANRPAVNARRNEDSFAPVMAKFVRFTVLATRDKTEPCLDELQIYADKTEGNVALASTGAKATASSLLPGYAVHQIPHLNDGKWGNDWSWISQTPGTGWAQIELPRPMDVTRVVWSRDAGEIPRFDDRLPIAYRIEVSLDSKTWQTVSTEAGRAAFGDYIHPDRLLAALTDAEKKRRADLIKERQTAKDALAKMTSGMMAYIGQFSAPDTIHLLNRGDVMQRGEEVAPGGLTKLAVLSGELSLKNPASEAERRLELARWITRQDNPLSARVFVNRVWQHHLGRGIVATPSDFGRNGSLPTHPALLDWLARDFIRNGGRIKRLHRMLVTSYTYRQSNADNPKNSARDAGNVYLWRMPLQRMEAEAVRDAILQTSGKLDRRMGGAGYALFKYTVVNIGIYEPLEEYGPETWRRGIYQTSVRAVQDDLLGTFDLPECSLRAPKRENTTTALQALCLLNGSFMTQQADFFAERVLSETKNGDTAPQVQHAFRLAFGRPPTIAEARGAVGLVRSHGLNSLCRALLNANEFLYY